MYAISLDLTPFCGFLLSSKISILTSKYCIRGQIGCQNDVQPREFDTGKMLAIVEL